ncbi:MAG: alpha/beta fold hydrolase [Cyanobacteria bacterium P01_G01_bin.54]
MNKETIAVGSHQWFYRETQPTSGDRQQTVVLLHGIPSTSHSWRNLMPPLAADGYRCLAPDWLGFGFSDQPDRRDFAYTPDAYQTALGDWLDALELDAVTLVVQGYLGHIGVRYALAHPKRVERLAILNAPLVSRAKLPWAMQQWAIPLVGDMLTQDPLLIDRTLERGSGFVVPEADLTVYRKPFLKSSAAGRALIASIQNLQLSQITAELEAGLVHWPNPLHLLWGIADPWLESTPVSTLAKANPQMTWHPFAEAKHYAQEHWSAELAPVLIDALRSSPGL